ncbi:hypothetical protein D4764_04G0015230 [Takifugu flavidus]|uniref:Uncharacterized protein n=1 Tax=Takifugu flavidus TaxID=433684 RepID=A0A5C6N6B2_9TELE|nr:hypothetical protein D4764_04G0015230 [Takifugu flavidus]
MEVLGDYVLQFGKYKGKSFRWLLQNDVGYTVYLIKNVQSEEAAGLCMADSHSKDSLQSFVSYALSFQEIQALLTYEAGRGDGVTASSEDDQLVGFGARAKSRWKEIWDSRGDGYADFVIGRRCVPGTRMSRLQQHLLKRQQPTTSSTPAEHPMKAPAEPLAMEEDVEMEREMLSIHNSDLQVQSYAMPVAAAALPRVPPGAKTVVSAGVGRPRVIVSVRGQYFIFPRDSAARPVAGTGPLTHPPWVEKLPVRFTNLLPAFLTYKKAACKSVMDELRRSGKSPTDMANQVNELMHLKYERAHLAYLHAVQNVREAEAGAYGQRTMGQLRQKGPCIRCSKEWPRGTATLGWKSRLPLDGQAQAMTGVVRWNFQRPVDMKKPGAVLPAVFDPASMWELNSASMAVTGQDKCPAFTSLTETLEKDVSGALPLPLKSSPRSARTGPMKTGGGVFVLDHTRWTLPMKDAIDSLLQYHHGDKDILRLVDPDYADTVHRSAADPNSLLRPTTRFHISRYVKHLAKLLNTSSSLNTSPEKLLETQQLWYSLTEGSKTTSVPVVTMETAVVTPPTAALPTPLTQDSIEKIVQGILEMEQQQRPEQKMRQTKPCLACGQPKSPYGTGGSSIHFFYQQGPVRYFYCSRKVHQTDAAEGLSDPRMPFEQFAASEFFQRELEATKKRVEEKLRDRSAVFSFMMASQMIFFHYRHPFSTQKTPRFPSCLREHVLPLPPCLNPRFSVSTFPFAILWVSES